MEKETIEIYEIDKIELEKMKKKVSDSIINASDIDFTEFVFKLNIFNKRYVKYIKYCYKTYTIKVLFKADMNPRFLNGYLTILKMLVNTFALETSKYHLDIDFRGVF